MRYTNRFRSNVCIRDRATVLLQVTIIRVRDKYSVVVQVLEFWVGVRVTVKDKNKELKLPKHCSSDVFMIKCTLHVHNSNLR